MDPRIRKGNLLGLVPVFLFLFCFKPVFSQTAIDDRQVFELITNEQAVPGISYIFYIHSESEISDSLLFKSSIEEKLWISDTLRSYAEVLKLQSTFSHFEINKYGIKYMLFDKEVDRQGVAEYISSLFRNDLFTPTSQTEQEGRLVVLGSKSAFKPFYRMKIKVLNDIKLIILLISLSLFLFFSILLVLIMFNVKRRKHKKTVLTERFKSLSYEPISTLLFEHSLEELEGFSKSELIGFFPKDHLSNTLFKDVMIQEIIQLNKNMKGDFKSKLKLLYRKLGLVEYTLGKLKSRRWDIITSGIVEINEMDVIEANEEVLKFVNHRNFYIRTNAISTLLNISADGSLKVLADQTYPLSRWQQMKYYRLIKYLNNKRPVQVNLLFESSNKSVRIYGYKLVRYLGLFEYLELLKSIYPTSSGEEKVEILNVYNAFSYEDGLEQIHSDLFTEDPKLFSAIIKVLKNIGSPNSQAMLVEYLVTISDFEKKRCILEAIHCLNPTTVSEILIKSDDEDIHRIANHLQDPILSYV